MLRTSTRKRSSSESQPVAKPVPVTVPPPSPPRPSSSPPPAKRKKKQDKIATSHAGDHAAALKKDKVYCICKTKYDATKFYVGCDVCSNWFHGSCIGITEKMSRGMTEYVCEECRSAKENDEIYCLCRQPYDESQFYIGCERCTDWFHGRCVGILQAEAESIDEYICPRCDPKSKLNYANLKRLNTKDYDLVKKTLKQIQTNKNSWPFKEPVDPNEHPKYYEAVKEPMDLQTIDLRVNQGQYEKLAEFIGDITRIFENCRYFNPQGTAVAKAAENLENFFAQKITLVREKVLSNK
jgi:nucleosome-remodeling factor subunit BPTF